MTLMQVGHTIAHVKRNRNLFMLELAIPNKAMQVIGRGHPTHLVSKNKNIRIWHCRFGHASNARIIRASKLLTGMGNFNNNSYDPTEVYSNSKHSVSNNNNDNKPKHAYTPDQASKASLLATPLDNDFDSLCTTCIASKQTCIVL